MQLYYPHGLSLSVGSGCFHQHLSCHSESERDSWISALRNAPHQNMKSRYALSIEKLVHNSKSCNNWIASTLNIYIWIQNSTINFSFASQGARAPWASCFQNEATRLWRHLLSQRPRIKRWTPHPNPSSPKLNIFQFHLLNNCVHQGGDQLPMWNQGEQLGSYCDSR